GSFGILVADGVAKPEGTGKAPRPGKVPQVSLPELELYLGRLGGGASCCQGGRGKIHSNGPIAELGQRKGQSPIPTGEIQHGILFLQIQRVGDQGYLLRRPLRRTGIAPEFRRKPLEKGEVPIFGCCEGLGHERSSWGM